MTSTRRFGLAAAVAALTVLVPVAPVAVGSPAVADVATASAQADAPQFVDAPYSEHRGDVVRVPVAVPDGGDVTVTIQDAADGDYAAMVTLYDDNGDGRVTLLWNTYEAGSDDPGATFRTAADGDDATVRDETTLVENHRYYLPPAGAYDLQVGSGSNATPAADRTTLQLVAPDALNVTVLRAAGDQFGNLTSPADVAALRRAGELGRAPPIPHDDREERAVLFGDLLVLRVRAPGLAGAFATADGPNATARFEALLGEELGLVLEAPAYPMEVSRNLRFSDFNRRRVVPDPSNDTYYLVVDPDAPAGASGGTDIDEHDSYAVRVGVPPDARVPADGRENTTEPIEFVGPIAGLHSGVLDLRAGAVGNVAVSGTAVVPPGSEVVVRVRGDASSLPVERRVVVGPDGRFRPTFDLSALGPGDAVEVVVRYDGETLARESGRVHGWAVVRIHDPGLSDAPVESVRFDVNTSSGGFVSVRRGWAGGPVVGVSEYLPPGNHSDVQVSLDEPLVEDERLFAHVYWDADGDREFDAEGDGRYTLGDPSAISPFEVADGTPATPSGTIPTPGAGLAVVALVAAALATVHRRHRD